MQSFGANGEGGAGTHQAPPAHPPATVCTSQARPVRVKLQGAVVTEGAGVHDPPRAAPVTLAHCAPAHPPPAQLPAAGTATGEPQGVVQPGSPKSDSVTAQVPPVAPPQLHPHVDAGPEGIAPPVTASVGYEAGQSGGTGAGGPPL